MPQNSVGRIYNLSYTSQEWSDRNPVLGPGEIGYDTTLKRFKIGDGQTAWSALPFMDHKATLTLQRNGESVGTFSSTDKTLNIPAPSLTGDGASGTWNISVSGNAATASKMKVSAAVGSTNRPIYLDANGDFKQLSYTISKSVPSNAIFTDTTYSPATTSEDGLMSSGDKTKLDGLKNYTLPVAGTSLGGIKNGYSSSGKNYAVQVETDGTAFVNVPWTDTTYTLSSFGITATKDEINFVDGVTSNVQTQINSLKSTKVDTNKLGVANGVATLGEDGKLDTSQLPSSVDEIVEGKLSTFPDTGEAGKIYVDTSSNKTYRWSGSQYTEISPSITLGTSSSTAYRGDYGNTAYQHSQATGNPHGTDYNDVGAPSKTGTGASGTWGISITGNAATASKATALSVSTAVGGTTKPVYINSEGKPVAISYTIASNVPSGAKFTDTTYTTTTPISLSGTTISHANSGVTTGSYGPTTSVTSGSFNVPQVTVNATGHVTKVTNRQVTFPSSVSGNAGTATKLQTARTISLGTGVSATATSFDGSKNITIPVTGIKESYLTWGGKNFSGSFGPIDAAMIPDLGANRFAFLKTAGVTVEYSRNAGGSWTDYGATDTAKAALFSTGSNFVVGKGSTGTTTPDYQLRVTVDSKLAGIYTDLNKFCIYCSTSGSTGSNVTIEGAKNSSPTTFTTFADEVPIAGWSGYNIINTTSFTTYSNSSSQYQKIRFTFKITGQDADYPGLSILRIMAFGGVGWTTPSNMAENGHLYSWDSSQNATFPARVSATSFAGSGASLTSLNAANISSGTLPVARGGTGATSLSSITVGTASKLGTADLGSATRGIYLDGGVPKACTYTLGKSVPSNAVFTDTKYTAGTGISISGTTISHANVGTAGTYGPSANATLTYSGTFTVPYVTTDARGHVSAAGVRTFTMPSPPTATIGTTNGTAKRFVMGSANQTSTAGGVNTNSSVYFTGSSLYAGGFYVQSSRKFKENIAPTQKEALDILKKVEVVDFNYIDDKLKTPKVGFIAEDVNPLLSTPEMNSMDTGNCIGLLIKAIQELDSRVTQILLRGEI